MKYLWFLAAFLFFGGAGVAQQAKTKNVVIITFDGLRWRELFTGADSTNLFGREFNTQDSGWRVRKYWAEDTLTRRKKLLPFFWNYIAGNGQVYGNRTYGNLVNVSNRYWFSYPGYNEMFTGYPDTLVNSNDHPHNQNINVQEFINRQPGFEGKVAAFTSWDAFYRILNDKRSGFPINSGFNNVQGDSLSDVQKTLNNLQHWLPKVFGGSERHDGITYSFAKEYAKLHHPRVLQLSFIETDAFAHDGKYDFYLDAAHYNDAMIEDLWNYMQSDPFYKDQTTFIITVDHGRGEGKAWRHHYYTVPHSNEIFFAVMGPDTKPLGEIKKKGQLYQKQFAQTIASFLGLKFENGHPTGAPVQAVLPAPAGKEQFFTPSGNGQFSASSGEAQLSDPLSDALQLSDPQATGATRTLYNNLSRLAKTHTMFGHQDDLAYGVGWSYRAGESDIKRVVNDYPAVYGWDLSHIEIGSDKNIDGVPFSAMRQFIKDGYKRGGVITLSWHLHNPLTGASAWDTTHNTVRSILEGGSKHALYLSWLDKAAAFIHSLKDDKGEAIPILFRPFHELTGNWFWWCRNNCTPEEFKQLWRFTVNYLKQEKNLHNLIYLYNTDVVSDEADYLERYPGDDVVDMITLDMYQKDNRGRKEQIEAGRKQLQILCKIAGEKNKPAALAEAGYEGIPDPKWWTQTFFPVIDGFPLSYALFWRNAGYMPSMNKMHYYVPYPGQASAADFKKFYKNPRMLFEKKVRALNIYQQPTTGK